MINLQQILNHLPSASNADLHTILCAVQDEIPKREGNLPQMLEYVRDFCPDRDLLKRVWDECQSLELSTIRSKAATQWISPRDEPYIYSDSNPIHHAKDIEQFKAIKQLLNYVNDSNLVTGPLDACLLIKYNSDQASLSPHADDEPCIDQDKAICSFSLGPSERTLEFFSKSKKAKLVKKFSMVDNSMVVMRPGTQQVLKHCVRNKLSSKTKAKSNKVDGNEQLRYCLSFRALAKKQPDRATVTPRAETVTPPTATSPTKPVQVSETPEQPQDVLPKKKICLLAGDSFAARMDKSLLGKRKLVVENIAVGGSKLAKVNQKIKDFADSNPDKDVTKMIISVGTNDIRNCKHGIDHLRGPFKELCNTISELFPNSKVYFQSLLPLPIKHKRDWYTNDVVIDLNRVIYNECVYRHFYYIDAFWPFTKYHRKWGEPITRFDNIFEVNGIHPHPEKGIGILAKKYMRALHSKHFNPLIFQ